jgi:hypothetical protein
MLRTYREFNRLGTFEERFKYLQLRSQVGVATFGFERYLNQRFYTSAQWRHVRQQVIARDYGCDLGFTGYDLHDKILVHHMNPISVDDVTGDDDSILDPEFLVSVSLQTHNAIHFGDESLLPRPMVVRRPGDTKLW